MVKCREACRQEFQLRHFLLQHDNPRTFVQFQCGYQKAYLFWRVFWALFHVGWIIASGIRADLWAGPDRSQYVKWFIYLTDWAYFTLTVATLLDAIVVVYVFIRRSDIRHGSCSSLPWYIRAVWCVSTTANTVSVVITAAYWGIVYDGSYAITSIDAATHIVNSVYVVINILVTGMPVRFQHFWFPMVYGVVYMLFSLFYYLAGGTNHNNKPYIYPALNWNKPGTAVLYSVIIVLIVTPAVHFILFALHCVKLYVSGHCSCCKADDSKVDTKSVEMS